MNRALFTILAVSFALGLAYARATPLGGAPDEGAHLQYVRHLATTGRLPVLDLTRRRNVAADASYEAHQPPLYYALAVPFYRAGRALGGEAGAGQACRLLSLAIGLAGTALVWRLAREAAPDRPALWATAAAIVAFLPMRLSVNASVSNDALAEATSTLALLAMIRVARGAAEIQPAIRLGGALGLALLAKQSALLLLPPALTALYLGARAASSPTAPAKGWPEGDRRTLLFLRSSAATAGVALALAGWWFVRNHLLYGDPLGQRAFNWYFADTPRWVDFRDHLGWSFGEYLRRKVLPTAFASFWGAFGHLDPSRPELFMGAYGEGPPGPHWGYPPRSWVYPILLVATFLAAAGGILHLVRHRARKAGRTAPLPGAAVGLPALHLLFVVAAFLNFNATYFQAQGRYLFPALGIVAIGLAGGWLEWGRRRERAVAVGIGSGMLLLALYALFGVLAPGFRSG